MKLTWRLSLPFSREWFFPQNKKAVGLKPTALMIQISEYHPMGAPREGIMGIGIRF